MRPRNKSEAVEPLDPIAFTLAMWLGLIVAVTGVIRLSEQAAAQASITPSLTAPMEDSQGFNARLMAFGG